MNHLRLDVGDLQRNGPRKDGHSLRDEHACAFARAAAAADDRPLVPQVAAAGVAGA